MVPNLDLIILTFLHGCFIACVLLLVISAILSALVLAFSLALFSISIIDLHGLFSSVSRLILPLKENLKLGLALLVVTIMDYAIGVVLASKPLFDRMVSQFKSKARHVLNHFEDLLRLEGSILLRFSYHHKHVSTCSVLLEQFGTREKELAALNF